jgi:hypothetical protein
MAFNVTTAAAIASLAKTVFDVTTALLRDELDHETMLRNIKAAIAAARDQIIQFMLSLRLDDLQGDVDGLLITFEAYDPIPEGAGVQFPVRKKGCETSSITRRGSWAIWAPLFRTRPILTSYLAPSHFWPRS